MKAGFALFPFVLGGCAGPAYIFSDGFIYAPIQTSEYKIATWQKMNASAAPEIHIYLEGDGNAYNAWGQPTYDPTPHSTTVRDLVARDSCDNVVYIARPCQFIMDKNCKIANWTTARFSQKVIDSMTNAIQQIAGNKKITLIGYSGGAMVSGLVIKQNPNMNFKKWVTIAGVLDHKQWTDYFGDTELAQSLNLDSLPNISQTHFIGAQDTVVPYKLAKKWTPTETLVIVNGAGHDDFSDLPLFD